MPLTQFATLRLSRFEQAVGVLSLGCFVASACAQGQDSPSESPSTVGGSPPLDVADGEGGDAPGSGGTGLDTTVQMDCARTVVTAVDTTAAQPADILVLVDSSPSMLDEIQFVRQHLNEFSARVTEGGVDTRVILVSEPLDDEVPEDMQDEVAGICIAAPLGSGSCPDDTRLPNFVHIPDIVSSSNSLDMVMKTRPQWIEHVRSDALRALLIVSDADALYPQSIIFGDPPLWEDIDFMSGRFFEDFTAVSGDVSWTMNAVYPFSECAYADGIGKVYAQLVERTGGVAGDLCEQDFEPVFDRLADRVVEEAVTLACEWELPAPVAGQTFSTELVQVTRTSAGGVSQELLYVPSLAECEPGGWHFDDSSDPARVLACPQTCDSISHDRDGKIEVAFGCEIVQGCAASDAVTLATPAAAGDAESGPLPCEWVVPEPTNLEDSLDVENVNVRYVTQSGFGVLLGEVDDVEACSSADNGWYRAELDGPTRVVACPSTCETLKAVELQRIEVLFGCETKQAPIVR